MRMNLRSRKNLFRPLSNFAALRLTPASAWRSQTSWPSSSFSRPLPPCTALIPGAANHIRTAADAAKALQPLAGHFAFLLFALGIVGTGMLAIPVLAGSAAYAVSETFGWRASLESKPHRARKFYTVIAVSTVLGVALTLIGLDPIRALFLSALVNGLLAVPLMLLLMMISV